MQVNYSDQSVMKGDVSLFLAGPTPRSIDVLTWRKEAVQILGELGFEGIVYVPEKEFDDRTFDYDNQVWWEREALYNASVIVFWVPRNSKTMPAFTTNVEFGYWLAKNSDKVFYGRPDDSEKNRYLDWLYQTETGKKPINDLRELLSEAMKYANNKNVSQKVANKDVDFYELSIISELVKKYPEISALVGDVDFTPNSFGITGDKITYGKMFFSSASENEVKEFDRTVLSVLLYHYIKDNRYEKIIEQQAGKTKLSRETFNKLRNFILANFNTPEKEELLLYYLVINDLGKSQKMIDLLRERGIETVDHDMVLRYLLEYEMLPSLSRFSEESRQSLINILDNGINIGQVIQGECVDYSFACLNNLSDEDKILMLGEAILDIGGILGHINNQNGSVNLNEGIVEDFLILTNIMSKSVDPRRMGGKYLTDKACNMQVAALILMLQQRLQEYV